MKKLLYWLRAKLYRQPELSTEKGIMVIVTRDAMVQNDYLYKRLRGMGFKRVIMIAVQWNVRPIEFIPFEIPDYWEEKV